jgi:hypothetical protein
MQPTCLSTPVYSHIGWLQVPGNGSAPAQIWADGFHLLLGLTNNPALPNIIYAVGKLLLNESQPHSVASQNVVVEVDTQNRNTWSIIATLHNDVSRALHRSRRALKLRCRL